jgi:hypothetical protein
LKWSVVERSRRETSSLIIFFSLQRAWPCEMVTTVLRVLQGHSIDVTNTYVDIKSYTNGAFLTLLYFITFQKILWNTQIRIITNFVFFFWHIFNFSYNSMKYSNSHNNKNHYEISCFFFFYFRFFIFLFFFIWFCWYLCRKWVTIFSNKQPPTRTILISLSISKTTGWVILT